MTADEAKKIVVGNEFLIYAVNSGLPMDEAEKTWEQAIRIVDELSTFWNTDVAELDSIRFMVAPGGEPGAVLESREKYRKAVAAKERCAKRLKMLTAGLDPKKSDENWFLER